MRALTRQQQNFVEEYLIDLNGAGAARRCGYAPSAAGSASSRMLRTPHVKAALEAAMAERARKARLSADKVLDELANVAFFDVGALFDAQGDPIPPAKLDPRVRAGLGAVEMTDYEAHGRTPAHRRFKVRPGEKVRALALIGRHMGVAMPGNLAVKARMEALESDSEYARVFGGDLTLRHAYELGVEMRVAMDYVKDARERGAPPEELDTCRRLQGFLNAVGDELGKAALQRRLAQVLNEAEAAAKAEGNSAEG